MQKECTHRDKEARSGLMVSSGFTEKDGERLISKLIKSLCDLHRYHRSYLRNEGDSDSGWVCFTKHYPCVELIPNLQLEMLDQINTRRFSSFEGFSLIEYKNREGSEGRAKLWKRLRFSERRKRRRWLAM